MMTSNIVAIENIIFDMYDAFPIVFIKPEPLIFNTMCLKGTTADFVMSKHDENIRPYPDQISNCMNGISDIRTPSFMFTVLTNLILCPGVVEKIQTQSFFAG